MIFEYVNRVLKYYFSFSFFLKYGNKWQLKIWQRPSVFFRITEDVSLFYQTSIIIHVEIFVSAEFVLRYRNRKKRLKLSGQDY